MSGWRPLALAVLACIAARDGAAQAKRGGRASIDAVAESSAVARAAWGEARRAASPAAARDALLRAVSAWPTQPAYWEGLARAAARAGDVTSLWRALEQLTRLGVGGRVAGDSAVRRLTSEAALGSALARLVAASAPVPNGVVVAAIADTAVFAEGVDAHPASGALYVASIRHRTVFEVLPNGGVRDLEVSRGAEVGAIYGVRVHPDGETLLVTTAPHAAAVGEGEKVRPALLRLRIDDGAIVRRWTLPEDGHGHLPGDLAVARDGTVLVTDSETPVVLRLTGGGERLEAITDPRFRSLQGVAFVPGDREAIVADYSHGLFVIDVRTGRVRRLTDAAGTTVLGIDGISWHDGGVVAVQNGVAPPRIVHVRLDRARRRVEAVTTLDRQPDVADEPTIGTMWRGSFVYVANSQWEKYDERGQRIAGTTLRPTLLVRVTLGAASSGPSK